RTVGRVFAKAMAYFLFFSTLALIVGMIVAHVVQPGAGMNINPAELDQTAVHSYVEKSHDLTLVGFLMDIIPKTLVSAFVDGNILRCCSSRCCSASRWPRWARRASRS
ncbi:cation:dicarboxylase symporter family transporter, partial [Chromobacterium amazonense]